MRGNIMQGIFIWGLLLLTGSAYAQESVPGVQVELVIFKHHNVSEEVLQNLLEMPKKLAELNQPAYALFSPSTQTASSGTVELSARYQLGEQYQKLIASEEFEVLQHVAWEQPRYSFDKAFFISIVPENRGGLLKGNVRLTYDRLYQLKINLLYDADSSRESADDLRPVEQISVQSDTVVISMEKLMTNKKIYHFDHALVGVLAAIHEPGEAQSDKRSEE